MLSVFCSELGLSRLYPLPNPLLLTLSFERTLIILSWSFSLTTHWNKAGSPWKPLRALARGGWPNCGCGGGPLWTPSGALVIPRCPLVSTLRPLTQDTALIVSSEGCLCPPFMQQLVCAYSFPVGLFMSPLHGESRAACQVSASPVESWAEKGKPPVTQTQHSTAPLCLPLLADFCLSFSSSLKLWTKEMVIITYCKNRKK